MLEGYANRACFFGQQKEFLPTLADGEEEGEKGRARIEPRREIGDVDDDYARRDTQYIARRDRQHIDNDDVFEAEGVGDVEKEVNGDDDREPDVQRQRQQDG